MKKLLALALAVLLVASNAYAVLSPTMPETKAAENDSNVGRDHIDVVVRHVPDDRIGTVDTATTSGSATPFPATEGAVVIWATQSRAILGRDVTMTDKVTSKLVAGIISEPGGIASGEYGRIRIWGYFDDVYIADSTHNISQGEHIVTSSVLGQGGADPVHGAVSSWQRVGVALGGGNSTDKDEIPCLINVTN